MTESLTTQQPWASMGALRKASQDNGWRLISERGGAARFKRRDPRSETGAVTLYVKFNRGGRIAGAWLACRTLGSRDSGKLDTILRWMSEFVPSERPNP